MPGRIRVELLADWQPQAAGYCQVGPGRVLWQGLGHEHDTQLPRGFRFLTEIINQAVWFYRCFSLSLREVELILAARGIVVSYQIVREWSLRF
jgi:putative transposase